MYTKSLATVLVGAWLTLGCVYAADDRADDARSINRSITIEDGKRAEDLKTVNGSIRIGNTAEVKSAKTVNGSVRMGDNSRAQELETVNGGVSVGARSVVSGHVTTVNGHVEVGESANVAGLAETVNGRITLGPRAEVGSIETVVGSVTLEDNARVHGGIHVKKPKNWSNHGSQRIPEITIGPGAEVKGDLVFDHPVKLRVHSTARIGTVKGAEVEKF